jgi:transcription elongation factor Elf1
MSDDEKKKCSICGEEISFLPMSGMCWQCEIKQNEKQLQERIIRDGESSYERDMFCPYCGAKQEDSWDNKQGENQTTTCYSCDKEFEFDLEYEPQFSTRKKPESKSASQYTEEEMEESRLEEQKEIESKK